ncbi:MAG: PorP/SprF family type IX secretion system membrane protein [Imperialibacter sp.]|uniref:PorP/SprF family type IX secretion system membrane protein n=1 Tax=Imperialibacter sp. TaxID=2038411 RepID=UPI0032EC473E
MRWMFLVLVCFLLMLCGQTMLAQQFNFSQYGFTDQRVNPALVGIGNYWKVGGIHRQQNTGPQFDIKSTSLSASYPLVAPGRGRTLGGIGVTFLDDKAGEGKAFKTQEAGLNYAMQVRTASNQQLALGVGLFAQTRKFSYDDFFTSQQYIPNRGYDRSVDSGESFDELRRSFGRLSIGLHWEKQSRDNTRLAHFGLSSFDINQPSEAFIDADYRVRTSFMLNGGFQLYQSGSMSLYPEVLYTYNGRNNQLNAGINWRYLLANKGFVELKGAYLSGGLFLAGFQFGRDEFRMGVSYDVPTNASNTANQGAFEFGFELKGLVTRAAKSKTKRQKKQKTARSKSKRPSPTNVAKRLAVPKEKVEETDVSETDTVDVPAEEGDAGAAIEPDVKTGVEGVEFEKFVSEKISEELGFETNRTTISAKFKEKLDELADRLEKEPWLKVDIVGHTDNVGSEAANETLSVARAAAVEAYLLSKGIARERLTTEGKGELEPISSNETAEGRSQNRRVELIIHR